MTSRLRKKRRLGREERETSINKTGIEPQCKAAVVIEKSAARSQNPDSPVEETANHRSQKPAILVELTEYTRDRVTEKNRRQNKETLSRSLLCERSCPRHSGEEGLSRHVPHRIRVLSSVFLLRCGLHNESTQKIRVTICSRFENESFITAPIGTITISSARWSSWVTEELFEARQSALAVEKSKSDEAPTLYTCRVCGKGYKSSKAHEQHLKSLSHVLRFSQGATNNGDEDVAIELADAEEEEASDSLSKLNMNESRAGGEEDADNYELDPTCCLICDKKHDFGDLSRGASHLPLGLKVKRDFMCLYCSELCQAFSSLEAVRKHMEAKSHCKLHYGDKKARNKIQLR
ncbi:unnamed protein product [Brassica oleracea var. botrytis]|uniref:C2H2-type domain-containing protein n=1 Tax=Brassica oleracea TaxID=3712 RepID=A0A3P6F5F2_BRAOL|nr:unnamed protein product [Brassica oleracea]